MKGTRKHMTLEELAKMGRHARKEKAKARREKVKKLKAQGLKAPQIAEKLGCTVRCVHYDFSILKKEQAGETHENDTRD